MRLYVKFTFSNNIEHIHFETMKKLNLSQFFSNKSISVWSLTSESENLHLMYYIYVKVYFSEYKLCIIFSRTTPSLTRLFPLHSYRSSDAAKTSTRIICNKIKIKTKRKINFLNNLEHDDWINSKTFFLAAMNGL